MSNAIIILTYPPFLVWIGGGILTALNFFFLSGFVQKTYGKKIAILFMSLAFTSILIYFK